MNILLANPRMVFYLRLFENTLLAFQMRYGEGRGEGREKGRREREGRRGEREGRRGEREERERSGRMGRNERGRE